MLSHQSLREVACLIAGVAAGASLTCLASLEHPRPESATPDAPAPTVLLRDPEVNSLCLPNAEPFCRHEIPAKQTEQISPSWRPNYLQTLEAQLPRLAHKSFDAFALEAHTHFVSLALGELRKAEASQEIHKKVVALGDKPAEVYFSGLTELTVTKPLGSGYIEFSTFPISDRQIQLTLEFLETCRWQHPMLEILTEHATWTIPPHEVEHFKWPGDNLELQDR